MDRPENSIPPAPISSPAASRQARRSGSCAAPSPHPRRDRLSAIEDRIFTEHRLRLFGAAAVLVSALIQGCLFFFSRWLVHADGKLSCIDFTSMWISGRFAASSDPVRMYDHSAWAAAWKTLTGLTGGCGLLEGHISYPPTVLFFTYPVALISYEWAFALWNVGALVLYCIAVYCVLPFGTAVLLALTPVAVFLSIILGQDGLLVAALFGYALVFLEHRPWMSGIFLGLLTCKPQFGVLIPLALIASRNWRAFAGGTAASLAFGCAAALAFGPETWRAFVGTLLHLLSGASGQLGVEIRLESIFGLLSRMGAGAPIAWAAHVAIAVPVAAAICAIWAKPNRLALKAAALCIGAVTVTPYVLAYDHCLLAMAAAFLVSDGLRTGFLPGERSGLAISWTVLAAAQTLLLVPIGSLVAVALLALTGRRTMARLPDRRVGVSLGSNPATS